MNSKQIAFHSVFKAAGMGLVGLLVVAAGGCAGGRDGPPPARGATPNRGTAARSERPADVARSPEEADFMGGGKRPPTAKTLFSMARILETQGKDSESEYVLRLIIRQHPGFMPAYCDLAETLLRQRRMDEAVHVLDAAIARAPADAVLVNDRGMCELLRDKPGIALDYFTRATALSPDDARYRSNMAVALGMLGRYSEALALYRQVMPEGEAHYNLGVLCESRDDKARAALEFRAAQTAKASAPSASARTAVEAESEIATPASSPVSSGTTRPTG